MTECGGSDEPWLVLDSNGKVDDRFRPTFAEEAQWDAVVEWFNMNRDEIEAEGYSVKQFVPAWQSPTEQAIAFTREINRLSGWLKWMSSDNRDARAALRGNPAPMNLEGFCANYWNMDLGSNEDRSSNG